MIGAAVGAVFGGLAAEVINSAIPGNAAVAQPQAYTLVGMAATLASVCSVPLTSVLLLFELTKDYRILLPLMVERTFARCKNDARRAINQSLMKELSLIVFRRDIGVASDAKVTSDAPNPTEPNEMAGVSFRATENPPHCPDNSTFQAQNQWLRSPLVADYAFSNEMLNEHEELAIDEGTINLSSHYSQELLTTLSQALQNSGLDLSQASISVQINLGKHAANKRSVSGSTSNPKELMSWGWILCSTKLVTS